MSEQEEQRVPGVSEEEPLLGRVGDASQQDGKPLYHNFIIGKLLTENISSQPSPTTY